MERIGREAEVMRQLQQAEHYQGDTKKDLPIKKLPMSDDFDAAEAAEEAAFEAEELAEELAKGKYPAETEKKLAPAIDKTTQQAKEDADRAHIKQAAEDEVAQREQLQSRRLQRDVQSHVSTKRLKKISASLVKLLLVYTPIALVFVIGLLHFVNISMLIKPIEQIATNAFGAPVTISKVHASVWPQPHLVLEDVTIGADGANQKIQVVNVLPVISALFDDVKVVKSLIIDGVNIQYANFSQALIYINKATSAKNLKIEQINLKNLTLNLRDLQLAPFDGKLTFNDSQTLKSIDLVSSNDALSVTISPQGGSYSVSVKASNWTLPLNPKIVFSALNAEGIANQNKIEFNQITGEIYGGNLTAKAIFNLPQNNSPLTTTGSFSLVKADTALLLTAFNSAVSVAGKLNLNGNFSCQSARANQQAQAASVAASFDISQGSIGDIELVRAVMARGSQSLAGDATDFNRLTGTVKINQGQYQYAKLVLVSPQFRANGYLNINANEAVTGKINADLAAQSRRLQATFSVTGRGKDLKSN